MKRLILVCVLALCGSAAAQDYQKYHSISDSEMRELREQIRKNEGHESAEGADASKYEKAAQGAERVRTETVGDAARLLDALPKGNVGREVTAYRVEIFNDNTASARERAYEAYSRFRELCPEIGGAEGRDIRYDSPKYTVRVGAFLTHEEATALCGRLRSTFKAYVRTEQLPLSLFAE